MKKKVLIVGGVAGGASAAARLRRLDENIEIVVFEKGEYISFANCGLPYYVGEAIKERDALLLQTPEKMKSRFNIDVRINSEVISIDADKKTVKVNSRFDGEYEENYDYLVLSPGAKPIKPNLPGIESNKIFTVRNVPDIDKIKHYVDNKNVKNAVVIGGGFIGIEMAENLKERGVHVTLIEAAPHILAPLDSEFSALVEKELNENCISIILEDRVTSFNDSGVDIKVNLSSGKEIVCDMVVSAIGVTPDTKFIKGSGINLGEKGHIKVDEHMRTNKDGVFAVGDAISVKDFVNGNETFIPLAGPANRQGRIVADNIANINSKYKGTLGTSIIKVFDMVAASTGNNERTLNKYGIKYNKVYLHPMSHAGYYPNATPLTIKVIYDAEGKILGAQALGYEGVDKFIDVIATTIKFGGTMDDLTELELAYAPPFLSAKSPANMAGFMAQNQSKSLIDVINIDELKDFNPEKSILLDVRDEEEVINGAIKGAINIPVNNLRKNISKLDKNKEILIYCAVGIRGYIAGRILTHNGFKVKNLNGGYKTYSNYEYRAKEIKNNDKGNSCMVNNDIETGVVKELNATGLSCPGPLMQVKATMDNMNNGDILKVKVSDEGFYRDIAAWTKRTGNQLINIDKNKGIIEAKIKKGLGQTASEAAITTSNISEKNGQTMVVFSGDLDKAIASFIIANGAATMGKKVTMLFTFWGLNILRKPEKVTVSKNIIEKAFGIMMPRGSKKLGLSKMNMGGMGSKMIRGVMKNKNIQSLEDLMQAAIDNGVEIVACTMSMDVMGIKKEELIDGITYGGVGYYLGEAEESNVNLFI
ncbi:CoA-disulfide reductase [Clostridium chauvoei]|uniref:CoA-disulfide reductase n=2 Tax=Clostridium chauvoei TaxID=46867 RepID=A0ABD4REW9_9CLOT|nr:CoA-disulfide reductase [Clostridium chauvoei]ATD54410.1 CoA-disulfide reductase [Clostridium chauvoei]ATD57906.1 pyridine nucleotide-disulfide oxidoreductase [Clostridium chauvoei]MBX7279697.1 CoA-disulfide reductase [Clostridium chauvoei]MBX7282066.1 CoA-disulfide reductase [Clostridium chauvoei]MBX7284588.1 CoA-disulfide reductase [Clostridium chauvoei]